MVKQSKNWNILGEYIWLKLTSPVLFFNVATRKYKITCMAHITFLLNSTAQKIGHVLLRVSKNICKNPSLQVTL